MLFGLITSSQKIIPWSRAIASIFISSIVILAFTMTWLFLTAASPFPSMIIGENGENSNSTSNQTETNQTDYNNTQDDNSTDNVAADENNTGSTNGDDNDTVNSDNQTQTGNVTLIFRIISNGHEYQNLKIFINGSLELNFTINKAAGNYISVGNSYYIPIQYDWQYDSVDTINLNLHAHCESFDGKYWIYNDCDASMTVQNGSAYQLIWDYTLYTSYPW